VVQYTVAVKDSSQAGIAGATVALTAANASNTITSQNGGVTDASGQAVFNYTGASGGADTLTATATKTIDGVSKPLASSSTSSINVSSNNLVFTTPAANTIIPFSASTLTPVTVTYTVNGAAQSGTTVNFSATRGNLTDSGGAAATSAVTGSNGSATIYIHSNGNSGAGASSISATIASGPSANESVNFVATVPASISIQASPTTIAPSATSQVTAVVLDSAGNPVFGQTVAFNLTDPTSGNISPGSQVTDITGTVTATYTAGTRTSPTNGVSISASIPNTAVTTLTPAVLTVGGTALHIALGTTNRLQNHTPTPPATAFTEYDFPWVAVVTDAAGNPAPSGTVFRLQVKAVAYQKGWWVGVDTTVPPDGKPDVWGPNWVVTSADADIDATGFGCQNEDLNFNGILDAGEDYNGNGQLDPQPAVSVPDTVALDPTGSAAFNITYPKNYGNWLEIKLTATASVAGTESTASQIFVLPVLFDDIQDLSVAPPSTGAVDPNNDLLAGPFGYAAVCSDYH
jgi:hypothetical protein